MACWTVGEDGSFSETGQAVAAGRSSTNRYFCFDLYGDPEREGGHANS